MKKNLFLSLAASLVILILFSQSAVAEPQGELTVSAAMSLKNAFEKIGKAYEATHRGVKILFNFGAYGNLMRQIEGGAPVDAFASASKSEMDDLDRKGLIISGSRIDFASNSLVLIVPSRAERRIKSFADLNSEAVKKIAVGDPKTVPVGRYAGEALRYYKVLPGASDKVIFAENVRQISDYVGMGEVDAGIVYASDISAGSKEVSVAATASTASHGPIVYSCALIRGTKKERQAMEFLALLASAEGAKMLEKYGFVPRQNKSSRAKR
jgi:molybdate transport system substrate-binding protein